MQAPISIFCERSPGRIGNKMFALFSLFNYIRKQRNDGQQIDICFDNSYLDDIQVNRFMNVNKLKEQFTFVNEMEWKQDHSDPIFWSDLHYTPQQEQNTLDGLAIGDRHIFITGNSLLINYIKAFGGCSIDYFRQFMHPSIICNETQSHRIVCHWRSYAKEFGGHKYSIYYEPGPDYYVNAIHKLFPDITQEQIENDVNNELDIVFVSDDITTCRKHMSPVFKHALYGLPENQIGLDDFKTMINANNLIISNSTFAIMAGAFNYNQDRIVRPYKYYNKYYLTDGVPDDRNKADWYYNPDWKIATFLCDRIDS